MQQVNRTVRNHERCECWHCRCEHLSGFGSCTACPRCIRYTWPGPGAKLPHNHRCAKEWRK